MSPKILDPHVVALAREILWGCLGGVAAAMPAHYVLRWIGLRWTWG